MKVNSENFITIQGWMRTELNLKGNDLLVYAVIYGFSQTDNQKFTGSLQYLADWCGATKQGILKNLLNLIKAGLIIKVEELQRTYYYTTKFTPYTTKFTPEGKQSLPNNISNNIEKESISKDIDNGGNFHFGKDNKSKSTDDIQKASSFIELYHNKCPNLPRVTKMTDKRIKAISKIQKKYTQSEIIQVFESTNNSEFLTGNNNRGWKADIDFITREEKFVSILEGKYSTKHKLSNKPSSDMGRKVQRMTSEQKKQLKEDMANGKAEKF